MLNRPETTAPQARSWREIPQQVKPRAMSAEGRRRKSFRFVKLAALSVLAGGLLWGGWQVVGALQGNQSKLVRAEAPAVKDVVLFTDGVLDHKWLARTLALPKGTTLMQLDLYKLRAQLTASGQVRAATLTRTFPATLTVSLNENSPVARLKLPADGAAAKTLLVARDGTVFEGEGFADELLASLPWLEGATPTAKGAGYTPVPNMEPVADLLAKAKLEAEHLYRTWQTVSIVRVAADREIEVSAAGIAKIRFATTEDYFRQLARLDAILDETRAKTSQPIREIDLAIAAQATVAFDDPTLAPGVGSAKPRGHSTLKPIEATAKLPAPSFFPNFQPKTKL